MPQTYRNVLGMTFVVLATLVLALLYFWLPASMLVAVALVPWMLYIWKAHPVFAICLVPLGVFTLTGTTETVSFLEVGVLLFALVLIVDAFLASPDVLSLNWFKSYLLFFTFAMFTTLVSVGLGQVGIENALRETAPFIYYLLLLPVLTHTRTWQDKRFVVIFVLSLLAVILLRDFNFLVIREVSPSVSQSLGSILVAVFPGPGTPVAWYIFALIPLIVRRRHIPAIMWPLMYILSFVGFANIILGGTRSFWFGLATAFLVAIFLNANDRQRGDPVLRVIFSFGTAFVLLWGVLLFAQSTSPDIAQEIDARFGSLQNLMQDNSVQGRLEEADSALQVFLQSPILGNGLGYQITSNIHVWLGDSGQVTRGFLHSHLTYLLAKTGLIGTILFGVFYLRFLNSLYISRVYKSDSFYGDFSRLLLVVLITLGITSVVNSHLTAIHSVVGLMMLVGVVLNIESHTNHDKDIQE